MNSERKLMEGVCYILAGVLFLLGRIVRRVKVVFYQ